jgi:hypothetical protein
MIASDHRMQSAVLCHAAADRDAASELAAYLELNCPQIRFDTEEFFAPSGILDAAERAISADFPILLFSPAAVPHPWPRTEWEPILIDEARRFDRQIAFFLLHECKFPQVLRRGIFFDCRRALKRWLLCNDAFPTETELPPHDAANHADAGALEMLVRTLADRPGMETNAPRDLALAFAHEAAQDFEGVFWLNCAHRSPTGIAGDTAGALGLKLRGPLDEDVRKLGDFCARRRILLVFEHASPGALEWAAPGGKASFLFVAGEALPPPRPLAETLMLFARWHKDPASCLRALRDAQVHVRRLPDYAEDEWPSVLSLARASVSLLRHSGRLAEACEFLEVAIPALRARGCPFQAAELEAEKRWILEEWGWLAPAPQQPVPASPAEQLSLFG